MEKIKEQIRQYFSPFTRAIKSRIFGANNEKLDFIMDSFYKLSPPQRSGVLVGGGVASGLAIIGVLLFYFSRVDALERELNDSFNAIYELQELKADFDYEDARNKELKNIITRKTSNLRIKPFFEETATAMGVTLQGLAEQKEPFPAENPLAKSFKFVKVQMRLPNISLPRLMKFLVEVEKSGNFLALEDLDIRSRFGTKLFFDVDAKFRGYVVEGS